jgi:hypothetical protein
MSAAKMIAASEEEAQAPTEQGIRYRLKSLTIVQYFQNWEMRAITSQTFERLHEYCATRSQSPRTFIQIDGRQVVLWDYLLALTNLSCFPE